MCTELPPWASIEILPFPQEVFSDCWLKRLQIVFFSMGTQAQARPIYKQKISSSFSQSWLPVKIRRRMNMMDTVCCHRIASCMRYAGSKSNTNAGVQVKFTSGFRFWIGLTGRCWFDGCLPWCTGQAIPNLRGLEALHQP